MTAPHTPDLDTPFDESFLVPTTEPGRYSRDWKPIRDAAMKRPGEWLKVTNERFKHSTVVSLQRGRNRMFPIAEWDIRSEGTSYDITGTRQCTLVLRYNPTKKIKKTKKEKK